MEYNNTKEYRVEPIFKTIAPYKIYETQVSQDPNNETELFSRRSTIRSFHLEKVKVNPYMFVYYPSNFMSDNEAYINTDYDLNLEELLRKHQLDKEYKKEIDSQPKFNNHNLVKAYNLIANEVKVLDYEFANVEVINGLKIKFTLFFNEGRILIINKFLNIEGNDLLSNVLYSIFLNRTLIASNSSEINELIKAYKKYLSI